MKKNLILCASLALLTFAACKQTPKEDYGWLKKGIDAASYQMKFTTEEIADSGKLPRSIWTGYDMVTCRNPQCSKILYVSSQPRK